MAGTLTQRPKNGFWPGARTPSLVHTAVCSAFQQEMGLAGCILKLVKALWGVDDKNRLKLKPAGCAGLEMEVEEGISLEAQYVPATDVL